MNFKATQLSIIASIFLLSVILLIAVLAVQASNEQTQKMKLLELNKEKWLENKPALFSYGVSSGCIFVSSIKMEQTEFALISLATENNVSKDPISIEALFATAKEANLRAFQSSIEYHAHYGFPTRIDVDWEKNVLDDECFFNVDSFEVKYKSQTKR